VKRGFFITGTDTGVGKSVITAGLAGVLARMGRDVGVMKPVQSGAKWLAGRLVSEDAILAIKAAGIKDSLEEVNPIYLEAPLAPTLAAKKAGYVIELETLTKAYRRLQDRHEIMLVEGAGGLAVPLLSNKFLVAHLVKYWDLPIIIVARGTLGTINHTVLTVEYARKLGLATAGFIVNGCGNYREAQTNAEIIKEITGVPFLGILPWLDDVSVESSSLGSLVEEMHKRIDWSLLLRGDHQQNYGRSLEGC